MKQRSTIIIIDAINELEMNGRLLIVLPALQRTEIPVKESKYVNLDKEEKIKIDIKKTFKLEEIIKSDANQKRNLYLAALGMFRPERVIFFYKGMNEFDSKKFQEHYNEKILKLKNPNHFVSKTRILLKNIPKSLDEETFTNIVKNFKPELKNKKICKQIKFLKEKEKMDKQTNELMNKGVAFIEFIEHQVALDFIDYIK